MMGVFSTTGDRSVPRKGEILEEFNRMDTNKDDEVIQKTSFRRRLKSPNSRRNLKRNYVRYDRPQRGRGYSIR